jgi:hypothetical protein
MDSAIPIGSSFLSPGGTSRSSAVKALVLSQANASVVDVLMALVPENTSAVASFHPESSPRRKGIFESPNRTRTSILGAADDTDKELPHGRVVKLAMSSNWGDAARITIGAISIYRADGRLIEPATDIESIAVVRLRLRDNHEENPNARQDEPTYEEVLLESDSPALFALIDPSVTATGTFVWSSDFLPEIDQLVISVKLRKEAVFGMIQISNASLGRVESFSGVKDVRIWVEHSSVFEGVVSQTSGERHAPLSTRSLLAYFSSDPRVQKLMQTAAARCAVESRLNASVIKSPAKTIPSATVIQTPRTVQILSPHKGNRVEDASIVMQEEQLDSIISASMKSAGATGNIIEDEADVLNASALLREIENDIQAVNLSAEGGRSHNADRRDAVETQVDRDMAWLPPALQVPANIDIRTIPECRYVTLQLLSTFGDAFYTGLTGIECYVADEDVSHNTIDPNLRRSVHVRRLNLGTSAITAEPGSINVDGHEGDPRNFRKLVDGTNVSTDDFHMFLVPLHSHDSQKVPYIRLDLGRKRRLAFLRVWNYNRSLEDTLRGVKFASVYLDDLRVTFPALGKRSDLIPLRKAPGNTKWDFGQVIRFNQVRDRKRIEVISDTSCALAGGSTSSASTSISRGPKALIASVFRFAMSSGPKWSVDLDVEVRGENSQRLVVDRAHMHRLSAVESILAFHMPAAVSRFILSAITTSIVPDQHQSEQKTKKRTVEIAIFADSMLVYSGTLRGAATRLEWTGHSFMEVA